MSISLICISSIFSYFLKMVILPIFKKKVLFRYICSEVIFILFLLTSYPFHFTSSINCYYHSSIYLDVSEVDSINPIGHDITAPGPKLLFLIITYSLVNVRYYPNNTMFNIVRTKADINRRTLAVL